METRDALDRARDAGLDLVEVAPQSAPPVCRIMDYGKWKYEQSKKERKSKAARHEVELKEVRIRTPKIGEHDLMIKVNHAREFLERGDRVQFSLRFRGRELAHIDEGVKVFESIKEQLADIAKVEQDCRREGRRISMLLSSTAAPKPKDKPEGKGKDKSKSKDDGDAPKGDLAAALDDALGTPDAAPAPDAPTTESSAENDGESKE